MSDSEEAVRRFIAGDDDAFEQLVRLWEKRIYNLALRFLGSREDAQDIVQETFISVFKSLRSLRDPRRFPAWLYRISLNHCRGRWRSRPDEVPLGADVEGEPDARTSVRSTADPVAGAHDRLEVVDLIRKSLMSLSEDHRAAIVLKEYAGLSLEEVATVMECPLSTAKSRLYHGLRGVQHNLRKLGLK
jgi:RNA polymerase sigma-70 factor (ECF subfamily)